MLVVDEKIRIYNSNQEWVKSTIIIFILFHKLQLLQKEIKGLLKNSEK